MIPHEHRYEVVFFFNYDNRRAVGKHAAPVGHYISPIPLLRDIDLSGQTRFLICNLRPTRVSHVVGLEPYAYSALSIAHVSRVGRVLYAD